MYTDTAIKKLLTQVKAGRISTKEVFERLKTLPYEELGFAKLDTHRSIRKGFPEVIYCQGKTIEQIEQIAERLVKRNDSLLLTRANERIYNHIKKRCPALNYNPIARVIYHKKRRPTVKKGSVIIITAGTSDIPVAEEAKVTLEVMGDRVEVLYDVGVAGIHRLLDKKEILEKAEVVIVVAGMEGALASVVGGLISKPVIAVPTSVGYGASFRGIAPLLTMLNSCAPGVAVVNIDNGFGAGYFASLINR